MAERIDQPPHMVMISNPQGGYNRRNGLDKIEALASQHNIAHIKATTLEQIKAALQTLSKQNPQTLIINGGDGTIDMVLSLIRNHPIFEKEPVLAILKGGTTNLIHRELGLKGTPYQALKKTIAQQTTAVQCRPLQITADNPANENLPTLYGFFLGTGAIPKAILRTRQTLHTKKMNGPLSETLMLVFLLAQLFFQRDLSKNECLKPTPLTQNAKTQNHIFLALSPLKQLIPGIKSTATADQAGILYMDESRKLKKEQTSGLTLETPDPWVLDGEMHEAGKIEIKLGSPVTFLCEKRAP